MIRKIENLLICGGGNGMHVVVPVADGSTGCRVKVYTPFEREAAMIKAGIKRTGGLKLCGAINTSTTRPFLVTSDPVEAAAGADMVLLVLPAFAHGDVLRALAPHLPDGVMVGAMPARSGFKYQACSILAEHGPSLHTIFGLQTLPWACRIKEYGTEAEVLGVKNVVGVAAIPVEQTVPLAAILTELLGLTVYPLANMLALSLANVGQIIHPGIMYGLFRNYDGQPFGGEEIPLFYNGVTEEIAAVLQNMSNEIQLLAAGLQEKLGADIDLSGVPTLQQWLIESYAEQIGDSSSLARLFSTNRAYKGLKAPVLKVAEDRYVPDFHSRYLVEDVPAGLIVTCALARLAGIETPEIDRVVAAASAWMGKEYLVGGKLAGRDIGSARVPQNYGIHNLKALKELVTRGGNTGTTVTEPVTA